MVPFPYFGIGGADKSPASLRISLSMYAGMNLS
jgi:hypothetical protein